MRLTFFFVFIFAQFVCFASAGEPIKEAFDERTYHLGAGNNVLVFACDEAGKLAVQKKYIGYIPHKDDEDMHLVSGEELPFEDASFTSGLCARKVEEGGRMERKLLSINNKGATFLAAFGISFEVSREMAFAETRFETKSGKLILRAASDSPSCLREIRIHPSLDSSVGPMKCVLWGGIDFSKGGVHLLTTSDPEIHPAFRGGFVVSGNYSHITFELTKP